MKLHKKMFFIFAFLLNNFNVHCKFPVSLSTLILLNTGVTQKLQHFKDSGIGAIWLSPINSSPMIDFGYDISDFRDIEGDYGTMNDLVELTKKAKELGIKVNYYKNFAITIR